MKQSIVVSVLGDDTPGLVESLSNLVVEHNGCWVESKMASLAGKFAGILRVDLPKDQVLAFTQALESADIGLNVIFEESTSTENKTHLQSFKIELVGQDQPGIIHKLSSALAQFNGNVEDLESEVFEASMSGEQMFKADLLLTLPDNIDQDAVSDALEAIANELIVDINLADS